MDKIVKKLTDRDLIDVVVAWYKLDQTSEQLREAVAAYVDQNAAEVPSLVVASSFDKQVSYSLGHSHNEVGGLISTIPVAKSETSNLKARQEIPYDPQFEPTDEIVGGRGWMIDAWALYYGTEEFFHRISFGLLSMQNLAVLLCILISAAVMVGAWHSSASTERQKKATFKSMMIEPAEKRRTAPAQPRLNSAPEENDSVVVVEPADSSSTKIATSTSIKASAMEFAATAFSPALSLMEKAEWGKALANLDALESSGGNDLQPLLTLVKVEALIQKRDAEAMDLARQLLMDCKCGELEIMYDLLVARWMLFGTVQDRNRFLSEVASLPSAARQRMSFWAHIRNGSNDAMTEQNLESTASKGQSQVCDLIFLASLHCNQEKYDETVRELVDAQQKLRSLQGSGKSSVENWLLETAKLQLVSKIDEILNNVKQKSRKQIN